MEKYLTPKDVAEIAKVSSRTVANWLRKGLRHYKIGATVRVEPADLQRWFQKHSKNGLSQSTPDLVEVLLGEPKQGKSKLKKCQTRKETPSPCCAG